MPNEDVTLEDLKDIALEILDQEFKPLLGEGWEEAKPIAEDIARYWLKAKTGGTEETERILASCKRTLQLVLARYAEEGADRLEAFALKALDVLLKTGATLLKGIL